MNPMKFLLKTNDDEAPNAEWVLVTISDYDLLRIQKHRHAFLSAQSVAPGVRHITVSNFLSVGFMDEDNFGEVKCVVSDEEESILFHAVHLMNVAAMAPDAFEDIRFGEIGISFVGEEGLIETYVLPYDVLREAPEARSNVSIAIEELVWRDDSEGEDGSRLSTIIRIGGKDFHIVAHAVADVEDQQTDDGMSSDFIKLNGAFAIDGPQLECRINDRNYVLFGHAGIM